MKTQKEIIELLSSQKMRLSDEYGIDEIALFGSYARDDADDKSDVDIMVTLRDNPGIRFVDLAEELEDILGMKVDLVSRKGIKRAYFKAIEEQLVYV